MYLMRLAGLAAMTAVMAYAVAATPTLKWAFLFIAMLPTALYGRSVISADGGTLAYTMVVTALCLKAAVRPVDGGRVGERAVWMTLSILSKPPQLARSEARRVGKECVRTCRSRWSR